MITRVAYASHNIRLSNAVANFTETCYTARYLLIFRKTLGRRSAKLFCIPEPVPDASINHTEREDTMSNGTFYITTPIYYPSTSFISAYVLHRGNRRDGEV